jgi:hypothetical protein
MAGRKKLADEQKPTYITAGFYAEEEKIIKRCMERWRLGRSAAIRLLVRSAYSDPRLDLQSDGDAHLRLDLPLDESKPSPPKE